MAKSMRAPLQQARHDVSEAMRLDRGVATPERVVKSLEPVQWVDMDVGEMGKRQRISQVPLDRLLNAKKITAAQYNAGDTYRCDAYLGGAIPSLSVPTEPMGKRPGRPLAYLPGGEKRADAYRRWSNAASALGPELYPFAEEFLVVAENHDTLAQIGARVFGRHEDKRAEAIALEFSRLVLNQLIRHYDGA